jgi:hypothetical protein
MRDNSLIQRSILGPLRSVRLMSGAAWKWAACYLLMSTALLVGGGWLIHLNQDEIVQALLSLLLPESWHFTALALIKTTFAAQSRALLVNMAVAAGLVIVSITLFPVKERLSEVFERDANLLDEEPASLPLWVEAVEELKWLLIYLTFAAALFWLGYYPGEWRDSAALIGSYGLLFLTFTVDFISPTLFRHGQRYGEVFRLIARHPLKTISFGVTFAAAPILASKLFLHGGLELIVGWPIWVPIVVVLAVEVVAIVWACVGGTLFASQYLGEVRGYPPLHWLSSVAGWCTTGLVFFSLSSLFGGVAVSLYDHSRLLRCEASVDWRSVRPIIPSMGSLLTGEVETGVEFNVDIHNPTDGHVTFDRGRIVLLHNDVAIGESELPRIELTEGESQARKVEIEIVVELLDLLRAEELLGLDGWSAVVYLQLDDGSEFPIFL